MSGPPQTANASQSDHWAAVFPHHKTVFRNQICDDAQEGDRRNGGVATVPPAAEEQNVTGWYATTDNHATQHSPDAIRALVG
jgi:hypothetical protein